MTKPINPQRGTERWNAKLSPDDVRQIRSMVAERERLILEARNLSNAAIAKRFGVHENTVWLASNRATWIHV